VAAAATAAEMSRQLRKALKSTPTIELRLDWLRSDGERSRFLFWLKRNLPTGATLIATCRRREGGGKLNGDCDNEL
jgi:3-dehydroquinate dehydratase